MSERDVLTFSPLSATEAPPATPTPQSIPGATSCACRGPLAGSQVVPAAWSRGCPTPASQGSSTFSPRAVHSKESRRQPGLGNPFILQAWSAARTGPRSAAPIALPIALTLWIHLNWNITSPFHSFPQTCCFTRYMEMYVLDTPKRTCQTSAVQRLERTGAGVLPSHLLVSPLVPEPSARAPPPSTSTFS